jgi:hypothetical protein
VQVQATSAVPSARRSQVQSAASCAGIGRRGGVRTELRTGREINGATDYSCCVSLLRSVMTRAAALCGVFLSDYYDS